MNRFSMCLVAGVFACGLVSSLHADVVFEANFDSPEKMVSKGGSATLTAYSTNKATVETASPLAANAGGFLRVDAQADSKPGHAGGVMIKPESAASALSAMSQIVDGKVVLNGAIEFFFRSSEELNVGMSVLRVLDHTNGSDGLRLVILSHDGKPRVELIGPKAPLAFTPTQGKESSVLAPEIGLIMEGKTVYHLAIGFVTDEKGMVTMSMYAAEGPVAIDATKPLSKVQFTLNTESVKAGFSEKPYFFGKSGQAGTPTLQDFDSLRIHNKLPDTFEALK